MPCRTNAVLGISSERDVGKEENSRSTWASHVFVSSRAARDHGRSIFGLLSNDAQFTVTDAEDSPEAQGKGEKGNPAQHWVLFGAYVLLWF